MAGANIVRIAWNTQSAGQSTAANDQFLLASLGTGWFVTRIKVSANFVFGPLVNTLPNNATASGWPQLIEPSMLQGVQSGPTGYGGIANSIANVNDPHWWIIEETQPDLAIDTVQSNAPYSGVAFHQGWEADVRFGAVPQAVAQDFWVTVGWSVGQTIPLAFTGWFYGSAELVYG